VTVDQEGLTNPEEAREFVKQTGVDALAISVGTAHGAFRGKEGIQFERLEAIRGAVSIPLVLHGGSGLPDDQIQRALKFGIAKVNIDTELREAFHDTLVGHREDTDDHSIDPRSLLVPARDAVQKVVREKVILLGSSGKARLQHAA
jgi:fructose-bisphosphate aldolase class II